MNKILLKLDLLPTYFFVYAYLASKADKNGQLLIQFKTIMDECGLSKPTLTKALRALENRYQDQKLQLIQREKVRKGGNLPTIYLIHVLNLTGEGSNPDNYISEKPKSD